MSKQFVVINLDEQKYCMPIELVSGVIEKFSITNVPNSMNYVEGISNIRGDILPVVNLKKIFNLKNSKSGEKKLMSVSLKGQNIGMIVDSSSNVISVDDEFVCDMPSILHKEKQNYFNRVANIEDSLSIVIEPLELFTEKEQQELFKLKEN